MEKKTLLLLINPQRDFIDKQGCLYIIGGEEKIDKLASYININRNNIDDILIATKQRMPLNISHACYWKKMIHEKNEDPGASGLTTILKSEILNGKYTSPYKSKEELLEIFDRLPGNELYLWPRHCILGSWGASLPDNLISSLTWWSIDKRRPYHLLGYDDKDGEEWISLFSSSTRANKNTPLLENIIEQKFDEILVAGFHLDLEVNKTVSDMIERDELKGKVKVIKDLCILGKRGKMNEKIEYV